MYTKRYTKMYTERYTKKYTKRYTKRYTMQPQESKGNRISFCVLAAAIVSFLLHYISPTWYVRWSRQFNRTFFSTLRQYPLCNPHEG